MTNQQVVDAILGHHPKFPPQYRGCDDWKCGNPQDECTGVVTAMVATVHVIRQAIALGANLIIVHEPTFYTSEDGPGWFEDFPNSVYEEKWELLENHGIAIWRDHDHMHAHNPDGIFTGVLRYLGWEDCAVVDRDTGMFAHWLVEFPQTTVEALCRHIIDTIGINGARYIGDPQAKVSSLAIVGHLQPAKSRKLRKDGTPMDYDVSVIQTLEEKVDVILPGETVDWTVLSYVRDAVQLGRHKAMISIGHFNWEELGMRFTREWLQELLGPELKVTYVHSEDMYQYIQKG